MTAEPDKMTVDGVRSMNTPVPDPTSLTTEQLLRAVQSEREYADGQLQVIRERLTGIDRATELRLGSIVEIPKVIDEKVAHLASLTDERFGSIAIQFRERDTRSERESKDNKVAVDAAFAAQKEAANEQNKSNTLAIAKSEAATVEAINKLGQLAETSNANLANQIAALAQAFTTQVSDLKERVSRIESVKQGGQNAYAAIAASVAFLAVAIGIIVTVIAVTSGGSP